MWCVVDVLIVFKQKTAFEMRMSDWSSDVCSSDLTTAGHQPRRCRRAQVPRAPATPPGCHPDAGTGRRRARGSAACGARPRRTDRSADLARCSRHRAPRVRSRSEEHTSELQSLMRISYAVFCLEIKDNNTPY